MKAAKSKKAAEGVLIVPLWNWNYFAISSPLAVVCSNRTFMELKFAKYEYKKKEEKGSNRTFMELKFSWIW